MITCGTERRTKHEYTRKGICLRCGNWQPGTILRKVQDFWSFVKRGEGCWEWTGTLDHDGYGRYTINKSLLKASRVMWMFREGDIPVGLCVLHKCDNPKCVRPDHLFLGTRMENHHDMIRKGRNPHKLHPRCIPVIQSRARAGESQIDLAADYGVSETTIYRIIKGKRKDAAILSREAL